MMPKLMTEMTVFAHFNVLMKFIAMLIVYQMRHIYNQ